MKKPFVIKRCTKEGMMKKWICMLAAIALVASLNVVAGEEKEAKGLKKKD